MTHFNRKEFIAFKESILKRLEKSDHDLKLDLKSVHDSVENLKILDRSDLLKSKIAVESKALRRISLDLKESVIENIQNIERTRVFRYITQKNANNHSRNLNSSRSLSPAKCFREYSAECKDDDKAVAQSIRKSLEERRIEELVKMSNTRSSSSSSRSRTVRYGWGSCVSLSNDTKSLQSFKFGKYQPEELALSNLQFERSADNEATSPLRSYDDKFIIPTHAKVQKAKPTTRKFASKSNSNLNSIVSMKEKTSVPKFSALNLKVEEETLSSIDGVKNKVKLSHTVDRDDGEPCPLTDCALVPDLDQWWGDVMRKKKLAEERGYALGII